MRVPCCVPSADGLGDFRVQILTLKPQTPNLATIVAQSLRKHPVAFNRCRQVRSIIYKCKLSASSAPLYNCGKHCTHAHAHLRQRFLHQLRIALIRTNTLWSKRAGCMQAGHLTHPCVWFVVRPRACKRAAINPTAAATWAVPQDSKAHSFRYTVLQCVRYRCSDGQWYCGTLMIQIQVLRNRA